MHKNELTVTAEAQSKKRDILRHHSLLYQLRTTLIRSVLAHERERRSSFLSSLTFLVRLTVPASRGRRKKIADLLTRTHFPPPFHPSHLLVPFAFSLPQDKLVQLALLHGSWTEIT